MKPIEKSLIYKIGDIEIYHLKNMEVKPFVEVVVNLRLKLFKLFPYLYDGKVEDEIHYFNRYLNCESYAILLAYDKEICVGFTSFIPLIYEDKTIIKPLEDLLINIESCLYICECILLPAYQNRGVAKRFLKIVEDIAVKNKLTTSVVLVVDRCEDHKHRPEKYTPISVILTKLKYRFIPNIFTSFLWRNSFDGNLSENKMLYYIKELTVE